MSALQSQRLRLLERFVQASDRVAARIGRLPRRPAHLDTGLRGEDAAYFYLRSRGYIVVARRWRSPKLRGDLDLVAWDDGDLCFIEVKTRTSRTVATAESAVDDEKSQMLRRVARQYLQGMPSPPAHTRFDVLSIYFENGKAPQFDLIEGALDWY